MNSDTPNAHYEVSEGERITTPNNVGLGAIVGRSSAGIHLTMTEGAANQLATIISRWDSWQQQMQGLTTQIGTPASELEHDSDFWTQVTIQLLAAQALNLHGPGPVTHAAIRTLPDGRPLHLVADVGELEDELRTNLGLPPRAAEEQA